MSDDAAATASASASAAPETDTEMEVVAPVAAPPPVAAAPAQAPAPLIGALTEEERRAKIAALKQRATDTKFEGAANSAEANAALVRKVDLRGLSFHAALMRTVANTRGDKAKKGPDGKAGSVMVSVTRTVVPLPGLPATYTGADGVARPVSLTDEFLSMHMFPKTAGRNATSVQAFPANPNAAVRAWYWTAVHGSEGPWMDGTGRPGFNSSLQPLQIVRIDGVQINRRRSLKATDPTKEYFFEVIFGRVVPARKYNLATYLRSLSPEMKRVDILAKSRVEEWAADVRGVMGPDYKLFGVDDAQADAEPAHVEEEPGAALPAAEAEADGGAPGAGAGAGAPRKRILPPGTRVFFFDVDAVKADAASRNAMIDAGQEYSFAIPEIVTAAGFTCASVKDPNAKMRCIRAIREGYTEGKHAPLMFSVDQTRLDENRVPHLLKAQIYTRFYPEACREVNTYKEWEEYGPTFFSAVSGVLACSGLRAMGDDVVPVENPENLTTEFGAYKADKTWFSWSMADVVKTVGVQARYADIEAALGYKYDSAGTVGVNVLPDLTRPTDYGKSVEEVNYSLISSGLQPAVNLDYVTGGISRMIEAEAKGDVTFWVVTPARTRLVDLAEGRKLYETLADRQEALKRWVSLDPKIAIGPSWYRHIPTVDAYDQPIEFAPFYVYAVSTDPERSVTEFADSNARGGPPAAAGGAAKRARA